jgi:hypothetical protein
MSKKVLIFIILIILLAIGFGVWFFFFDGLSLSGTNGTKTDDKNLFPFGQNASTTVKTTPDTNTTPSTNTQTTDSSYIPRLRKLSLTPTAGGVVFNDKNRSIMRFTERATGHIFETYSDSTEIVRISNTTIPKIEEALWSGKGNEVLLRYLRDDNETIRTFYARISTTTSPDQAIEGIFLSDNIRKISLLNDRIFYTTKTEAGSTGIMSQIDGSKKIALINSSFGDWSFVWTNPKQILLYPAPTASATGFAYSLNTTSGEYTKISQSAPGLAGLMNVDGSYVLLSGKKQNGIGTAILDTKKGETTTLSLETMSDKCVWSSVNKTVVYCAVPQNLASGNYPDSWYQGLVSTRDSIWKIDVSTGDTEEIVDPEMETLEEVDVTKMSIDPKDTFLLFTNKKDMSLWSYQLSI